ncbi:uncharacterized protein F5891DRAFT_941305 [Suillus fuscotomentosus]|uniref:F-box domain-containing protein n=1 Tax=Suillus fuscotomentosus TaxID=1912939 RepID=A0AAD4HTE2_9AGAM|nr:uncharacterized protein F5891DRAFT_941305 [Suillus fuscotomentosus]KAG1906734.1 hypothetical protein F5891DRAFT_941305 [Suillus fuscotomentosus]
MHAALQNLEVIHVVSSHTERVTLPALASACRAFQSPALNVLWRDLHSMEPLVRCLPTDLFRLSSYGQALRKPLDNKMWDTLVKYTFRVRSITVKQTSHPSALIVSLNVIMLSYPSAPASLFPNLCELTWYAGGSHFAAEFLRMTLVPSLRVLTLRFASASSTFLSVLSSLGTLCPHLRSMTLRYRPTTEDSSSKLSPFIAQPISQLHKLHTLMLWDLANTGMDHIMQLQALRSLDLDLRTSSVGERQSLLPFPGFHHLHYLCLRFGAFERAMDLLSSLQVIRSKEIKIAFASCIAESSESPSMSLSQFLAILPEICDNKKLQRLSLMGSKVIHTELAVFTPLCAFRNLIVLRIERGCSTSISDGELCQMVAARPMLQVLKISCYIAIDTTAVPMFHGLLGVLRLCPFLTSLALAIDTTKLEGINLRSPSGENLNTYLNDLTLGNSLIASPLNVALILSGIFPYLEQVDLDCWHTAPMNSFCSAIDKNSAMETWASVNSLLHGFRIVRERIVAS